MASIQFTAADRDERGFVKVPAEEPRSLADLLPSVAAAAPATPAKRPTVNRNEAIGGLLAGVIVVALLLWFGGDSLPARPPQSSASTPAAAATNGNGVLEPSPLPATAPAVAGRLLIAFAAPDGDPLGAIESTRAITPTAHYGQAWVQADVAGSGLVWLRASDAPELSITGPDLRPRAAPPAAPVRPADPTDPPEPTRCAEVGTPGKMTSACGTEALETLQAQAQAAWLAQYGGNVGQVGQPTAQPMRSRP